MRAINTYEFIVLFEEHQLYCTNGSIPLLGNNNLDNILLLRLFIVIIIPVKKGDDIGILLNRS
ncbi:hypothetical protein D3C71_2198740 [compost metagenome]